MRGIDPYDGPMPDSRRVVSVFAYGMAGGTHRRQVHSGTGSPNKSPGTADGKRRQIRGEGLVARISDDYRPQLPVVGMDIPEPAVPCHVGTARLEETVHNRTRSVGRVVRRPYSDSEESDNDVWYVEIDDRALGQPTVDLCGEGCAQLDDFRWFLPTDEQAGDLSAPDSDIETSDSASETDDFPETDCTAADSDAADMNDLISRRLCLPPEEVSAGLDGTDDFPETDCAAADSGVPDMNDLIFRQMSLPLDDDSASVAYDTDTVGLNDLSLSPEECAGGRNTAADVMKFAVMIFRRTKLSPDEFSTGRNGGYIWHDMGTEPSVCNRPVTGSHGFGSSHRLGQCCLWFAVLHVHRIENAKHGTISAMLRTDSDIFLLFI